MSDLQFCPDCGARLLPGDRFCGDCGFDTQSLTAGDANRTPPQSHADTVSPASPATVQQPGSAQAPPAHGMAAPVHPGASIPAPPPADEPPGSYGQNPALTGELGHKSGGSQNALLIMIALLAVLFLGGGGIYWWLSRGEDPSPGNVPAASTPAKQPAAPAQPGSAQAPAAVADLSRASTYLSEPGLKCTFMVNYPDGTVGVVERTSARVVSHQAVWVSEVETGVEQGEAFGYGFHYVERPDGTYYILDNTPDEIFPALKNNLIVGQTWNYEDESGEITWKVMDMGVTLDLGFTLIENCLIVYEDNKMVDYQALTYYAPGRGIVAVKNPGGKDDYYKLTAMTRIDLTQAAAIVKQWSPNYAIIKDDRTQS